jgi:hypothetical protein
MLFSLFKKHLSHDQHCCSKMILYCSLDARQIGGGRKTTKTQRHKEINKIFVLFVSLWLKKIASFPAQGRSPDSNSRFGLPGG